jgi:hypothetical protein
VIREGFLRRDLGLHDDGPIAMFVVHRLSRLAGEIEALGTASRLDLAENEVRLGQQVFDLRDLEGDLFEPIDRPLDHFGRPLQP